MLMDCHPCWTSHPHREPYKFGMMKGSIGNLKADSENLPRPTRNGCVDKLQPKVYCNICQKQFTKIIFLNYHQTTQHPNQPENTVPTPSTHVEQKSSRSIQLKHRNTYHLTQRNHKKGSASTSKYFKTPPRPWKCSSCPKSFKTKVTKDIHEKSHDRKFPCEFCSTVFNKPGNAKRHQQRVHPEKYGTIKCGECEILLPNLESLRTHRVEFHENKSQKSRFEFILPKTLSTSVPTNRPDLVDPLALPTPSPLTDYIDEFPRTSNHRSLLNCLFCDYKTIHVHRLIEHNRIHTGEKPFVCKACDRAFASNGNLTAHIRSSCKAAKEIGLQPDILTRKKKIAPIHQEKNIKCSKCVQKFKTVDQRKYHEIKHGDKYPCPYCSGIFNHISGLSFHKNISHPNEPKTFTCINCGLYLDSWDKLHKHRKDIHKVESRQKWVKPAKSDKISDKKGSQRSRTWKCSKCPEIFATKDNKDHHEVTHGDKFACPFCPGGFETSRNLRRHKTRAHPEKSENSVSTRTCGITLPNRPSLHAHREAIHKKKLPKKTYKKSTKSVDHVIITPKLRRSSRSRTASKGPTLSPYVVESSAAEESVIDDDIDIEEDVDELWKPGNISHPTSIEPHRVSPPKFVVERVDPITSWVKSVTNNPLAIVSPENQSEFPSVIPTTVLKMEY